MEVRVTFRPRRQEDRAVRLASGSTVADLMRAVGCAVDAHLAVRGADVLDEGAALVDGEEILLLSAFSGG